MVLLVLIPAPASEDVFRRVWTVSRFDGIARPPWGRAGVVALLRPEPRAEYFQAPSCPYRMGGAHSFDPAFHGLCHYQSRVFGLGACPTLTILLRRTICGHLRRARPEKILNVFQRIRLRFFRACGLASGRTFFASSRMATSDRLLCESMLNDGCRTPKSSGLAVVHRSSFRVHRWVLA